MSHAGPSPARHENPTPGAEPEPPSAAVLGPRLSALSEANLLIARDDEVARLLRVLDSGGSALVIGESGTGKTAVVAQAIETFQGRSRGTQVVTVHAKSADQNTLARALAPLLGRPGEASPHELTEALRRTAGTDRLVLRIEDAHLLDESSRSQVGWWARQGEFSVVATLRRAAGSMWPWMELWRNRTVERIDLAAFDQDQVQAYLESVLGGPVSVAVGWRLRLITAGVPERVATVVRNERRHGRLSQIDGVWHWGGGAIPDSRLIEVVHSDLAALDDPSRSALELLAAMGPVPDPIVRDVAPDGSLQELRHRGLVTTALAQDGPYMGELMTSVMHPLYAETVRLSLSRERAADLFACVSHLVDDPQLPAPLLPPLVAFGLRAGVQVDGDVVRAAVERLFRTTLGEAAVPIIDDALRLGVSDELAAELLMYRALAMRRAGDFGRAALDLEQMEAVVRSLDHSPSLVARAAMARADHLHFAAEDPDGALEVLGVAVTAAREAGVTAQEFDELVNVRLGHALWAGLRGDHLDAAMTELVSVSRRPSALMLVAPVALSQAQAGRPEAALAIAARHQLALRAAFDEYPLALILTSMATMVVGLWAGRHDKNLTFDAGAAEDPDGAWRGFIHGYEAMVAGVWSVAEAELHAYEISLQDHDPAGVRSIVSAMHSLAAAAAGDRGHARDLIESSALLPLGRWRTLESEMRLMRLDAALWLGEDAVAGPARELAEWARERGDHRVELEALHRLCLVTSRTAAPPSTRADVLERLRALGTIVDGRRCALLIRHGQALLAGDAQMAEVHERELATVGLWLAPARSAPVATLTHREREIAQMAAGGMSSKAIAERLVLSVRTVDTHLARAYAKFGVHSREELASALRRRGG